MAPVAPRAYAEVKDGVVVNLVMMNPSVAKSYTESELHESIYVEISKKTGDANIGDEYVNGKFQISARILDQQWELIRKERDILLSECDWIVIKSQESGKDIPKDWKTYRQALRDITNAFSSPDEVIFPEPPTA